MNKIRTLRMLGNLIKVGQRNGELKTQATAKSKSSTMKKLALKTLEDLEDKAKREKYKNVPLYALPKTKHSDKSTNSLTTSILKFFQLKGFFATRIQSQGQYNQVLQRWTAGHTVKGIPDIFAQGVIHGKFHSIWVEVKSKATGDRLKPHQIAVHEKLRATGSVVIVAGDFDEFLKSFNSL